MELVPLEELSQQIRNKRKKLVIEQQKLAELADMSPSQVNRIEKNTMNPSYESVYRLWEILENMEENNAKTAEDVMNESIIWIQTNETIEKASKIMKNNNISQLPVKSNFESDSPVIAGRITERRIMEAKNPDTQVKEVMGAKLPEIRQSTKLSTLKEILKDEPAVLISGYYEKYSGIVTKADMI